MCLWSQQLAADAEAGRLCSARNYHDSSLTPGQTLRDIVNNPKVASDLGLARAAMGSCDVTLKRTNGSSCTAQKVRPGEFSEIVISQGDVIFFQQRTSGTEG